MSDISYYLGSDNEAQEMAEAEPAHSNENRPHESQVGIEVKKLLKDLPFDEQYQMLQQLTRGPEVTVLMGKEKKSHIQPKNLLCYYSSVFDKAFTSGFREATERTICFPEHSDMAFKMTVQWLYFGAINIDNSKRTKGDKLTLYIDFFVFANYIDLMGPFDSVLQRIRSLLIKNSPSTGAHSNCRSTSLGGRNGGNKRRFGFQEELDTVEGFAADLVCAFTSFIRGNPRFIDPLSKKDLDPYNSSYHSYHLPQHPEKIPKQKAAPRRVSYAPSFNTEDRDD